MLIRLSPRKRQEMDRAFDGKKMSNSEKMPNGKKMLNVKKMPNVVMRQESK